MFLGTPRGYPAPKPPLCADALLQFIEECYISIVATFSTREPFGWAQRTGANIMQSLVADRKTWDFKHKIKTLLGEGITLCSSGKPCDRDIEFSVPGNVNYGFIAAEAGYLEFVITYGAAKAEADDPSHRKAPSDPGYAPNHWPNLP